MSPSLSTLDRLRPGQDFPVGKWRPYNGSNLYTAYFSGRKEAKYYDDDKPWGWV